MICFSISTLPLENEQVYVESLLIQFSIIIFKGKVGLCDVQSNHVTSRLSDNFSLRETEAKYFFQFLDE